MKVIQVNNLAELPYPSWISPLKIDSDTAHVEHGGLIHIFKVPKIGEYVTNFHISCNPVLQESYKSSLGTGITFDRHYKIDVIHNYIESISLCVDSPDNIFAQIGNIPPLYELCNELESNIGIDFNFFQESPLLLGALQKSAVYLVIRFSQVPRIHYQLELSIGFLADETLKADFTDAEIRIQDSIYRQGGNLRVYLVYRNGHLNGDSF